MSEVIFTGFSTNSLTFTMITTASSSANCWNKYGIGTGLAIYPTGTIGAVLPYDTVLDYDDLVTGGPSLLSWRGISDFPSVTRTGGLITFKTTSKAATASGAAGEFLLMGTVSVGAGDPAWFTKGTITTLGGGGDLEIADVNIVSGDDYQINSLIMEVWPVFTY